ncbi:hypothetical protein D3C81_2021710 [compost metagenome]
MFPCLDPRLVLIDETLKCLPAIRSSIERRQLGEFAHRKCDRLAVEARDIRSHAREFHGWHHIRENHFRRVAIHPLPASRTAMFDRPGGRIAVE